jgi:hypothetical protein
MASARAWLRTLGDTLAYVLAADGRDDDVEGAFEQYQDYLASVRTKFPPSAYALATSDWYFNSTDHRCPHDAWLESLLLEEPSSGSRNELRTLSLTLNLLGAYHDGRIVLRYPRVFSYSFRVDDGKDGHRDWRYDELRLSERGNLIHEIEWCGLNDVGTWTIEASDLEFRWVSQ